MYVPNNIIRKENYSQLTWLHIILRVSEITLPQLYNLTADISHCKALNHDLEINFLSPAAHRLPRFTRYLP